MNRWIAIILAIALGGCGLLASAVADPSIHAFVLKQIFSEVSDTMQDIGVPFVLEYDEGETEHVWMLSVQKSDMPKGK